MRIRHFALAVGLILAAVTGAAVGAAAQGDLDRRLGLCPHPPAARLHPAVAGDRARCRAAGRQPPAQPAPRRRPARRCWTIPATCPWSLPEADPSNVTIRQLVRVSVAGKRLRLRFSNEGGSDALVLGAVHVGAAGPDGTVLPGSDHVVTFDGHGGVVGARRRAAAVRCRRPEGRGAGEAGDLHPCARARCRASAIACSSMWRASPAIRPPGRASRRAHHAPARPGHPGRSRSGQRRLPWW